MKSLLTLLMLFLIPIACAAESQPIEPRVKPAYPAKAEKKGIPGQVKAQFDVDENGRVQNSPSEAAYSITGNHVNGWRFWECRRP